MTKRTLIYVYVQKVTTLNLYCPFTIDSMQVKGEEACREWVNKVNDYRIEHGSVSCAAYPEKHKWYNLAIRISLSD